MLYNLENVGLQKIERICDTSSGIRFAELCNVGKVDIVYLRN